jgi:hypothetical protein
MRGPEPAAGGLKRTAQLEMIVDFAVIDDADRAGLVPHRLRAPLKIDHRQPSMTEKNRNIGIPPCSTAVGTAMRKARGHRLKIAKTAEADKSGDAAHLVAPFEVDALAHGIVWALL